MITNRPKMSPETRRDNYGRQTYPVSSAISHEEVDRIDRLALICNVNRSEIIRMAIERFDIKVDFEPITRPTDG